MNRQVGWILAGVAVLGVAFVGGRCSAAAGVSPEAAAELARHAGDSAVTSYRKSVASVIGGLEDSVKHYKAEAQAGAKIVIRRAVLTREDTAKIVAAVARTEGAPAFPPQVDTATVPLPEVRDTGGVAIAETLRVAPPPVFLTRRLALRFEPDTLLVAFLRTPEGLNRFTAIGTRAGLKVSVADAAAVAPPQERHGPGLLDVLGAGSCLAGGWAVAKEAVVPALGAGAACAVLLWRPRIRLPWPF